MPYHLRYHPDVKEKDIPKLNRTIQKRIKTAIEQRLLIAPEKYSEPLRRTLKGYRKLRVEDYRLVLKFEGEDILILGICYQKDVYERMEWRKGPDHSATYCRFRHWSRIFYVHHPLAVCRPPRSAIV